MGNKKYDIKQDKNGLFYFDHLPGNFRRATADDFYDLKNAVLTKKPFLVHGFYSEMYECYRVCESFSINKLKPWLSEGRVYVMDENEIFLKNK